MASTLDEHAFLLQLTGQVAGGLVVASHDKSLLQEVAGDGTHADATGSHEIDCLNIFQFHDFSLFIFYFSLSLMTSLAMISAESGSASFSTFSLSDLSFASSLTVSMANFNRVAGASASFT